MRKIDDLIVHCSATYDTMDIGVKEIRRVHVEESGWSDIGYHYVIRRNGIIEEGRPESRVGAHVKNHNAHSIGICLVGGLTKRDDKTVEEANFTAEQYMSLYELLSSLHKEYPDADLHGHNDYANKACPCFNARKWWHSWTGSEWRNTNETTE